MRWYQWLGVYFLLLGPAWLFIVGATIKERRLEYSDDDEVKGNEV